MEIAEERESASVWESWSECAVRCGERRMSKGKIEGLSHVEYML